MKRLILCASAVFASIAHGEADSQQQPLEAKPQETITAPQIEPAEPEKAPAVADEPLPAPDTAPVAKQNHSLSPDSILSFPTDILNEQDQRYTFGFIQLNADQYDKVDVREQVTKARLNVGSLGAYFSPEPGKVRVGLNFQQTEMNGTFKLNDVSNPASPQQLYEVKLKQKDNIPHLLIAYQASDYLRLAVDFSNTTRQQQMGGMTDDISYGSYDLSAHITLLAGYSLGLSFTPYIRIIDAITVEQEREISMLLRRDLGRTVVQGKITHIEYSKMDSAYKDSYNVELGGEHKVSDNVAVGGLLMYEPAYYRKSDDIASTNIATLVTSVFGRFRLQKNLTLTGELIRWKSAEVNKKVQGVEYIANAIVTGGSIGLSYTNI